MRWLQVSGFLLCPRVVARALVSSSPGKDTVPTMGSTLPNPCHPKSPTSKQHLEVRVKAQPRTLKGHVWPAACSVTLCACLVPGSSAVHSPPHSAALTAPALLSFLEESSCPTLAVEGLTCPEVGCCGKHSERLPRWAQPGFPGHRDSRVARDSSWSRSFPPGSAI